LLACLSRVLLSYVFNQPSHMCPAYGPVKPDSPLDFQGTLDDNWWMIKKMELEDRYATREKDCCILQYE